MFIVGIAASAGGLEAATLLVQALPREANCAFVLAQHMSPSHKSMMVQLLSNETSLDVTELTGPTEPEAGTIYVPQPGNDAVLEDGKLVLRKPEGHAATPKPSADRLFKSIAREAGENSVGIVLSGTGSDGSYGVQAIREAGGITIAQDPGSSKYDSMPVSAARTGCIDLTLTPQQIGQHLARILQNPKDLSELRAQFEPVTKNSDLFQILLAHTRVDFRHYKESTINRRIQRRMVAMGIEDYGQYVDLCRRSVEEVESLYRDLLISVTSFFRDPEQFSSLKTAIERRVAATPDEQIRIWVPGCATGEEAYSIAILAVEAMGGLDAVDKTRLQIFATDIDDRALAIGRRGHFPASATHDIPARLVEAYFETSADHLVVKPKLRSFLMFTRHNVFQDAPFMSIDLVSIRNVMIYFETRLQERVLNRIQYALKPEGMLFLGTSETTGALETFFRPLSPDAKIFGKRNTRVSALPKINSGPPAADDPRAKPPRAAAKGDEARDKARFDALVRAVVKDGFIVNRDREILRVYGDIAPFLEMRDPIFGSMKLDVLTRALAYEANSMLLVTLKHRQTRPGQWHQIDGRDFNMVRLTAYPILPEGESEPVVLFGLETETRAEPAERDVEHTDYVEYLENELTRTRDTLQVAIEQLQTSNEELQSLNEELQSSNEELQSTNEEMVTSNEELQSTNEELITVNEELLVNSAQLERASTELNGLIEGLPAEMMMLDQGLLIRHASKSAMRTFRLSEQGASLGHLSQCSLPPGYPPLVDICSQTLVARAPQTVKFEAHWRQFTLSITPLITDADGLIGLILLIDSVDLMADTVINDALRSFADIGTWRMNLKSGQLWWSDEVFAIHGLAPDRKGRKLSEGLDFLVPQDRPLAEAALRKAIELGQAFHFFVRLRRADGSIIVMESAGTALVDEKGEAEALIGVCRDYSRSQNEDLLIKHYNKIAALEGVGFYSLDVRNDLAYWSPMLYRILGLDPTEPPSVEAALSLFGDKARARVEGLLNRAIEKRQPFEYVEDLTRPDGSQARCRAVGHVECNARGEPTHVYGSFRVAD